jgi:hypothetical protein
MDISIFWVEWLGDKCAEPKVIGLSAHGHEARIFLAKNHVT